MFQNGLLLIGFYSFSSALPTIVFLKNVAFGNFLFNLKHNRIKNGFWHTVNLLCFKKCSFLKIVVFHASLGVQPQKFSFKEEILKVKEIAWKWGLAKERLCVNSPLLESHSHLCVWVLTQSGIWWGQTDKIYVKVWGAWKGIRGESR